MGKKTKQKQTISTGVIVLFSRKTQSRQFTEKKKSVFVFSLKFPAVKTISVARAATLKAQRSRLLQNLPT